MTLQKILIADDNEHVREALSYILEGEGYELWQAKDGSEALEKARDIRPHILLLDIMMPGINGYEVCRIIKEDPVLKDIYVIMLSAGGHAPEELERGRSVGTDDYVVKPFSPADITARIHDRLGGAIPGRWPVP